MNTFEQVSSDGHQMSLACGLGVPCLISGGATGGPMSGVWERDRTRGALYREVQCVMGNGHLGPPGGQTDTTEKITFPQLRWLAVIITFNR